MRATVENGERGGWNRSRRAGLLSRSAPLLLLAVTIAAGACSSSSQSSQAGEDELPPLADSPASVPSGPTALETALYRSYGEPRDYAESIALQSAISDCMNREGFEYIAFVPQEGAASRFDLSEEEYRKKYGYGINTIAHGVSPGQVDPNTAILEALDSSERTAYENALFGKPGEEEKIVDAEGNTVFVYFPNSCVSQSYEMAYGVSQRDLLNNQLQLEAAAGELEDRIDTDPRTLDAWSDWAKCMADAGYPFANRTELIESLTSQAEAAASAEEPPAESDASASTEEVLPEVIDTEASRSEILLAAIDQRCDEEVQLSVTLYRVRLAYQNEFASEHSSILDPYLNQSLS